ncbi:MAG: carbohydrate binding domain-containing protein [Bacteroidaceae bacterium]|nr:carbohydrate binding domain-containing protein [Bacteroidaceae bacterium]
MKTKNHRFINLIARVAALASPSLHMVSQSSKFVCARFIAAVLVGGVSLMAAAQESSKIVLRGTGSTATIKVGAVGLAHDVTLEASADFAVSPTVIPAGSEEIDVTVTYTAYRCKASGAIYLRSDMNKRTIELEGYGSPLPQKVLDRRNNIYVASEKKFDIIASDGFRPDASKGYTVEFRVRNGKADGGFYPYFVTDNGMGVKAYTEQAGIGVYGSYDAATKRSITNPANASGRFFNEDGEYHTYRYAVTPDSRAIVYRDGMALDTLRLADLCAQPEWTNRTGGYVENLLHNGGFEGESDYVASSNIIGKIEGWNVFPYDQYNSTQRIATDEINAEQDQYNHTLHVDRYMWNAGWAAAEISQIVDVAPNETYSFSALAKGGVKSNGDLFGSIRLTEYPDTEKKEILKVTSDSWKTYATDYTTSAHCKQLRVTMYLERDAWGSSISDLVVDNVKLAGRERQFKQMIGYINEGADVEYMTYDLTGAYAPKEAVLSTSVETLTIEGTGASATFTVTAANLPEGHDITVEAAPGFTVSPSVIPAGTESATVTVTYDRMREKHFGDLVVRCANNKALVKLYGLGSALEERALDTGVSVPTNTAAYEISDKDGFTPDVSKGYTVEFRARTNKADGALLPYFVTKNGMGVKGYLEQSGMGVYGSYNSETKRGISNPSTSSGKFYNDDNEFHTYRYAVTADSRAIVYRDGIALDTLRLADFCAQPEWTDETGDYVANLLHNPGFEGEYDFVKANNIISEAFFFNSTTSSPFISVSEIITLMKGTFSWEQRKLGEFTRVSKSLEADFRYCRFHYSSPPSSLANSASPAISRALPRRSLSMPKSVLSASVTCW